MLLRLFSRSSIFSTLIQKQHNFNAVCVCVCMSVPFLISQTVPAHVLHVCYIQVLTTYDIYVFCQRGEANRSKIKFSSFIFSLSMPFFIF